MLSVVNNYVHSIDNFPLTNGITNRFMGDFSLNQEEEEAENQSRRLIDALNMNGIHRLIPQHGTEISYAEEKWGLIYHNSDALVTRKDESSKLLASPTADCPILIITNKRKEFGAVIHAGWRSIKGGIIPLTINHLKGIAFPWELEIGIFPGICTSCFLVKPKFDGDGYFDDYILNGHLNLKTVIQTQLTEGEDIPLENINTLEYCSCHERVSPGDKTSSHLLFSYRRDKAEERNLVFLCV